MSSGCASITCGATHSSPCARSGSDLKKGETTAKGCTAEQTSCTNPGSVSSAERHPPPTVSAASKTITFAARSRDHDRRSEPVRPRPDDDRIDVAHTACTKVAAFNAGQVRARRCSKPSILGLLVRVRARVAAIYLIAFLTAANQFVPLLGDCGSQDSEHECVAVRRRVGVVMSARLCAGAAIGLAALGLVGFVVASLIGLSGAAILFSAAICVQPACPARRWHDHTAVEKRSRLGFDQRSEAIHKTRCNVDRLCSFLRSRHRGFVESV